MAERLRVLAEETDATRASSRTNRRAEALRRSYFNEKDTGERLKLGLGSGIEALNAGATERAIEYLREALDLADAAGVPKAAPFCRAARDWLAVAYVRLGEQENCLLHHDARSCIVPIRGAGVHRVTRGSRLALDQLAALIGDYPDDLRYRWLYNICAMTLGLYPDGVPAAWRIPASAFDSGVGFPRFPDVAQEAGVAVVGLSGGVVLEDLDGDGRLDLMASSWDLRDPLRYFRNDGRGRFEERTEAAGLSGITGGLNLVHADYDNDGDADVLVLRGAWLGAQGRQPNSLLRNNGDGTFADVTEAAGLLSFHPTPTAAFGDYDDDGWLDIFVGNESTPGEVHPCELYRNNGDGTFTDVAAEVGVDVKGFVKAAAWGDYDNDGRLDLFLSRYDQPGTLFHNDGPMPGTTGPRGFRFRETTAAAGITAPKQGFPAWFWDYDNDGWLDLLVGSYPGFFADSLADVVADFLGRPSELEPLALYRNAGDGTFSNVAGEVGLARPLLPMGSNYGDIDNDGHPDLYFGTGQPSLATLVPNRMFRNAGGRRFEDVTGPGGFGHLQKGHGVAFGDIDDDGDQDVYEVIGGAYAGDVYPNVLFLNPGNGNRWLTLELEGVRCNRSAIGARVRVIVDDETGREREIHALVGTGGNFGSSSLRQEMGLGQARAIKRLEVRWPGAREPQVVERVPLDRHVKLRQGAAEVAVVERSTQAPAIGVRTPTSH
jgi:hypothetical protein